MYTALTECILNWKYVSLLYGRAKQGILSVSPARLRASLHMTVLSTTFPISEICRKSFTFLVEICLLFLDLKRGYRSKMDWTGLKATCRTASHISLGPLLCQRMLRAAFKRFPARLVVRHARRWHERAAVIRVVPSTRALARIVHTCRVRATRCAKRGGPFCAQQAKRHGHASGKPRSIWPLRRP